MNVNIKKLEKEINEKIDEAIYQLKITTIAKLIEQFDQLKVTEINFEADIRWKRLQRHNINSNFEEGFYADLTDLNYNPISNLKDLFKDLFIFGMTYCASSFYLEFNYKTSNYNKNQFLNDIMEYDFFKEKEKLNKRKEDVFYDVVNKLKDEKQDISQYEYIINKNHKTIKKDLIKTQKEKEKLLKLLDKNYNQHNKNKI